MANGFGSLYVGNSGLAGAQNGLNVVANNISNADTEGYVRQQVLYEDKTYLYTGKTAAISKINAGLGVAIGDVVHTRDMFLDKAFRGENGRQSFYEASYEAAWEAETLLNQNTGSLGIAFSQSIQDLDDAFNEFSNTPGDEVSQNLVAQKASLFLERAQGVYEGLTNYQTNINNKIEADVERINELGKTIFQLNQKIQKVESAKIETAMELRDARDSALDELSSLCSITYKEAVDGVVKVQIEGTDFVIGSRYYEIATYKDKDTGYITPYWSVLSDPKRGDYYEVFDLSRIDPTTGTDIGEVKALLLARGEEPGTYMDMLQTDYYKGNVDDKYTPAEDIPQISSKVYENGIGNSIMVNTESEFDRVVHELVTKVNDLLSPKVEVKDSMEVAEIQKKVDTLYNSETPTYTLGLSAVIVHDQDNWVHTMSGEQLEIFDRENACVGNDWQIPTKELFSRAGCERYRQVVVDVPYADTNGVPIYRYGDAATPGDETTKERAYPVYETLDGRRAYLDLDANGNTKTDEEGNLLYVDAGGNSISHRAIKGYLKVSKRTYETSSGQKLYVNLSNSGQPETYPDGSIRYLDENGNEYTPTKADRPLKKRKEQDGLMVYATSDRQILSVKEEEGLAPEKVESFTAYAYNEEGLSRHFDKEAGQWEYSRALDSETGEWVLDKTTCYTLSSLKINTDVMNDPKLLAHMHQNGDIAYDLSEAIYALWNSDDISLNPSDITLTSFSGFYTKLVGEMATEESVFKTMSESLANTKQSIDNNRQAVIGVSTDEELQTMIKFQNAYNASSRYINVVNDMISTLINNCGTIH